MSPQKYRPDIDGLRAVAILPVVAFHAFPAWVPGGFVGVDVFFVISGYLISLIILERLQGGTFSFRDFYGRRIRRIFPALVAVLLASLTWGWFRLFASDYALLGKHVAAGVADLELELTAAGG
jgi:peptidoglycan/LPS O-acetylase OafA/YrhL